MPVIITPESEYGKELAKWNKPYRYEPFPKMLYMARQRPDGRWSTGEVLDGVFGGNPGAAESWTRGCQRIVRDEAEYRRALDEGWRESPREAMDYHEKLEQFVADAAAHRAYEDRNMGEAAQAEAAAADASTSKHLAEVPEQPRRPRGRPRKVQPPTDAA